MASNQPSMLGRLSEGTLRILALVFFLSTVLLATSLVGGWVYVSRLALRGEPPPPQPVRAQAAPVSPLLLQYQLDLPGRGEIFPALAGTSASEYWPVAVLSVVNTSDEAAVQTITAEVRGWSRPTVDTLVLGARETRQVRLNPELLPRAYASQEVRRASLSVRVTGPAGETFFADTRPVLLHGGAELYWGKRFANAQFVARWITPHEAAVLRLVSHARRYAPGGRLGGYNVPQGASEARLASQVRQQAEAVFRALQRSGISYVSSIFVYGEFIGQAQRIRLPRETLELSNANCMDVSVLFASAMENLGMHPVIVIVPGHAFTGVRLAPHSPKILYVDLTVLPRGSFAAAARRAASWLKKTEDAQELTVDVAAARALGIYPLPLDSPETAVAEGHRPALHQAPQPSAR